MDMTLTGKLRHAELWKAAKAMGGQSALARYLNVRATDLGTWINLKACPPPASRSDKWAEVEAKLYVLTGKDFEELFPDTLRKAKGFLKSSKNIEITKSIEMQQLAYDAAERLALPTPEEFATQNELKDALRIAMEQLNERERNVLKLRFGLDGSDIHTLVEAGAALKLTRERVLQIERKAIRKMQEMGALSQKLDSFLTPEKDCDHIVTISPLTK